jgi:hypothetical protein
MESLGSNQAWGDRFLAQHMVNRNNNASDRFTPISQQPYRLWQRAIGVACKLIAAFISTARKANSTSYGRDFLFFLASRIK